MLLILVGFTFAQPPGELLPIFPAPFDDVLVPWPDVERVDDALCWPDGPPFIGAAYTFMCFHSPLPRAALDAGLLAALSDAQYLIRNLERTPHWTGASSVTTYTSNWEATPSYELKLYTLSYAEAGTLFSIAAAF